MNLHAAVLVGAALAWGSWGSCGAAIVPPANAPRIAAQVDSDSSPASSTTASAKLSEAPAITEASHDVDAGTEAPSDRGAHADPAAAAEGAVDRADERYGPLVCKEHPRCTFDSDCEAGAGCFHTECEGGAICIAGDPCVAGCGHESCMIGDAREACEVSGNPDCDPAARIWVLLCE